MNGLELIVPTGVAGTGVSVSPTGKVTFANAWTMSVSGCFSSAYDNYLIVCSGTIAKTETLTIRFRDNGPGVAGNNYAEQSLLAIGGSVSGGRGTSMDRGNVAGWWANGALRNGFHLYVYGPALPQPTAWRSVTVHNESGAGIRDHAGTHSLGNSYEGFDLFTWDSTSPLTGSLTIYGYTKGTTP